jgi:hypothetical protein
MESQNVSAQLYFKQLPGQEGNSDSDANIEYAFQKQLDLSEYYKSKGVFESMKKDYMDKTMEGSVTPEEPVRIAQPVKPVLTPTPPDIKVGPRDFINKSSFGKSSKSKSNFGVNYFTTAIVILVALAIFWIYYLCKKKIIKN